ncbi:MAG: Rab family GTPase [Candidatus Heimdallarchaeota archaeon]
MAEQVSRSRFDYLFKTIVVGDGAVGKTAITIRFAHDKFQENYKMTIGVDFTIKQIKIKNKLIKCQIWDTGGQERFSKIRPLYYRGALGCLIVYDVTSRESFENLDKWVKEVKTHCIKIPIIIVGNKIDLKKRVVTLEQGKAYASKISKELGYKIPHLESSAKAGGETIKVLFNKLVKMMVKEAEKAMAERVKKKEIKKKK